MQKILWFCFLCVEVINLASQTPHTTSARGSIQSPHFLSDISATYTGHVNTMFATHAHTQNETIHSALDEFLLQARILYRCKPRSHIFTPTRRKICKLLIRRNYRSFATTTLQNQAASKAMLKVLGRKLRGEVASLCSTRSPSVLSLKPKDGIDGVINSLMSEMGTKAPTLLSLLRWTLKTRQDHGNTGVIIGMITSIMCKHRKASVCLFQRIVSLVLYTGHSSKQVILDRTFS